MTTREVVHTQRRALRVVFINVLSEFMFINLPKSTLRSVLIQLWDLDWVALTVQLASGLDGVLRLPWRNLGGGWIGKQRRYGGR